ncbi:MAG: efflux RND transporter periplasmic adaptor subunit [Pseudomonadota bacterium]
MRSLVFATVAALCVLLGGEVFSQGRPASVSTAFVTEEQVAETVAVFGQVVAGRESAVAARVAGVAEEVPLRVGDQVKAGDVLARLDTELLEIEFDQSEAEIAIAEAGVEVVLAQLERAQKAFERAQSLRANSTIAEAQLEDRARDFAQAIGARQEAAARLNAARNALRRASYNLENATVRAPFDGIVLEVATEIGQFIGAGSEIARLLDTGALEVEANIPSRYIQALRSGLAVDARTDAGGNLSLDLRAILPTEFSSTRTRPVRFDVTGGGDNAAAGQSLTLNVPVSAPRDALVVPKDALVQARGGWSVFVHQEGKAVPRQVQIGQALGQGFEVLSGLTLGDEVVVRGNERLRPGQDIQPMPSGPGGPAAPGGDAPAEAGSGSGTDTDRGGNQDTQSPTRQQSARVDE